MSRDTVLEEVREIREAYSKEFGDDITATSAASPRNPTGFKSHSHRNGSHRRNNR